jgi:hypothetical protein
MNNSGVAKLKVLCGLVGFALMVTVLAYQVRTDQHGPTLSQNLALAFTPTATATATATATPTPCPTGNVTQGIFDVTKAPYNAKCDGSTDDHTAINSAIVDAHCSGAQAQFPSGKTCVFNYGTAGANGAMSIEADIAADGTSASTVKVTGSCSAATACAAAAGTYPVYISPGMNITNMNMQYAITGTDCGCFLYASNGGASIAGPFFHHTLVTTTGTSVSATNPVAIYANTTYLFLWDVLSNVAGMSQGSYFKQALILDGASTQQPRILGSFNKNSYSSTVWNDSLYQVEIRGGSNAYFDGATFEQGPNQLWLNTTNYAVLSPVLHGVWAGDRPTCGIWLPSTAYDGTGSPWASSGTANACVINSFASATYSTTNGSSNITDTAGTDNVGDWVKIPGAGAAGGLYTGQVRAVVYGNPTAATYNYTTTANVKGYTPNYNGHIYRATTGGTSAATEPTWPLGHNGQVTDNTVQWTEYGEGAAVLDWADAMNISGGTIGASGSGPNVFIQDNIMGTGGEGGQGTSIDGVWFWTTAAGPAVYCDGCNGLSMRGNAIYSAGQLLRAHAGSIINSNCVASGNPWGCCTGSGTGTCNSTGPNPTAISLFGNSNSGVSIEQAWLTGSTTGVMQDAPTLLSGTSYPAVCAGPGCWDNTKCTSNHNPWSCCSGAGTGSCGTTAIQQFN